MASPGGVNFGASDRIKVSIADYAVASEGTLTTSGLGSCLGIAIYAPDQNVSALFHPMLPSRNGDDSRPPERFVDSGIDVVVEELLAAGADESSLRAKVAGGAAVVDFGNDDRGIEIVGEEIGGDCGRTVRVDAGTGAVSVERTDGVDTSL